jgi:hypothetical protein
MISNCGMTKNIQRFLDSARNDNEGDIARAYVSLSLPSPLAAFSRCPPNPKRIAESKRS